MRNFNPLFLTIAIAAYFWHEEPLTAQLLKWPVIAPRITQDYGCFNCRRLNKFHTGIDLTDAVEECSDFGPHIRAAAGGSVYLTVRGCIKDQDSCGRYFGNQVIIKHSEHFYTFYAHMKSLETGISTGSAVTQGQALGIMGETGDVIGCHLHFGALGFAPPFSDDYIAPGSDLPAAGFFGYTEEYPSADCNDANGKCLDPKRFLSRKSVHIDEIAPSVFEHPDEISSCATTSLQEGQTFVSIADYLDTSNQHWSYIALPSTHRPELLMRCEEQAPYGWLPRQKNQLLSGFFVDADGEDLDGFWLNVRSGPSSSHTALTKIWGGQSYWVQQISSPDVNCTKSWYKISIPSQRSIDGISSTGWVCGDFAVPWGGQCVAPSLAPSIPELKACGTLPYVETLGADNITQTSGRLKMLVNPNGLDTDIWFEWGLTPILGDSTVHTSVGNGTANQPASTTIEALSCDTTYYYKAWGQNSQDSTAGTISNFRTDSCSGSGTTYQELLSNNGFELGNYQFWVASPDFYIGSGADAPNPHQGTHYAFLTNPDWYPGNNLEGGMITPQIQIPASTIDATMSYWVSISTSETTSAEFDTLALYIVEEGNILTEIDRVSNEDNTGGAYIQRQIAIPSTFFGESINLFFNGITDFSYPTVFRVDETSLIAAVPDQPPSGQPSVTTLSTDQITKTTARLNMTVNANGADTDAWFDLEANDSTPDNDTQHLSIGGGYDEESISISVAGLSCGTIYYVEANATNQHGSVHGNTLLFTTSSCGNPPQADTDPARDISQTAARLTSEILPNGLATLSWFEWGTTPSLNNTTPQQSVGSGTNWVGFDYTLTTLVCGTQYYFNVYAENSTGTDSGVSAAFSTLPCDAPNSPPVAADDSYTTQEGGPLSVIAPGVLSNDSDPDGNPISASLITPPTNGTLTLNRDGSFVYMPSAGFGGSDSFSYIAQDYSLSSNTSTVSIEVQRTPQSCGIRQLTDTVAGFSAEPSVNADGTYVAFWSEADLVGNNPEGSSEIFLANSRTMAITQITNTTGLNFQPSISSDGTRIAFLSYANITGRNIDGRGEIYLYDTISGVTTQITDSYENSDSPSISGDGRRIAFRSGANYTGENPDGSYEIFLFDVSTSTFSQITHVPIADSWVESPSVNGDGTSISFYTQSNLVANNSDGSYEIFYYYVPTGAIIQLTNDGARGSYEPAIDDTGDTVIFYSWANLTGDNPDLGAEIFRFDLPTFAITQLTNSTTLSVGADTSGDGSATLFTSAGNFTDKNQDGNFELFYLNELTGRFTQLTESLSGNTQSISFSKDGNSFSFYSDADVTGGNSDGNFEIFIGTLCNDIFSDGFESGDTSAWTNAIP